MSDWEDVYAGFVIRFKRYNAFLANDAYVALRSDARRFTKKMAVALIEGIDDYVIEDAH